MKHLVLISAAIAALATALPVGGLAIAREQDRGGQHHGGQGGDRGGDRGRGPPERRNDDRRAPERRGDERGGPERRGDERRGDERRWDGGPRDDGRQGGPRRMLREDDGRRDDGRRRYEDGPYPPPDARPARRGGYLPDSYRGGRVDDYQRFRLRPPPRGYTWVRVNGGFALVSLADGRVFDVIPD